MEGMQMLAPQTYDARSHPRLSFAAARRAFADGTDTPRDFLERCIEVIEARDREVRAFVTTHLPNARAAADASTARYRAGRPLSVVDGLPIAIKDVFETQDMPTQQNSPLFSDWHTGRDSAHVYALRRAGASIVGKAATTEFAMATPSPARNPFDLNRTPGGSSSGSCAAVGAGMVPVASGSQVRGSMIRPAGFCGNYALKPTYGAINLQGGHGLSAASQCVMGPITATLEDCWEIAYFMSSRAGGDAGHPGLYGEPALGAPEKLDRVIRLDTLGWKDVEAGTKDEFERFLVRMEKLGVKVLSRRDDPRIEALEAALVKIPGFMLPLFAWENRWLGGLFRDRGRHLMSQKVLDMIEDGDKMTLEDYRRCLERRAELGRLFAATAEIADTWITLCAPGPAPVGMPVGSPDFADVSSNLLCPSMALPLLQAGGMPVGVQLMGMPHQDYRLARRSRWLSEAYLAQ
jgi:Asp-tRNA(Asn)/Glu-tRNA(Gln) amidotransferase A subunit family amidase